MDIQRFVDELDAVTRILDEVQDFVPVSYLRGYKQALENAAKWLGVEATVCNKLVERGWDYTCAALAD